MLSPSDLQSIQVFVSIVTVLVQVYAVVVISRAGSSIAKHQAEIAHAKHQFDLFDRRMNVLKDAATVMYSATSSTVTPDKLNSDLNRLNSALFAANFLFDDRLAQYLFSISDHAMKVVDRTASASASQKWLSDELGKRTIRDLSESYFQKMRLH